MQMDAPEDVEFIALTSGMSLPRGGQHVLHPVGGAPAVSWGRAWGAAGHQQCTGHLVPWLI